MEQNGTLRAGIVGAGIAGLSAAIALRRAGWDVEVFEKSTFKHEVGAAVAVGCNATRVLRRFEADVDAWGATDNTQVRMPRGDTLEEVWSDSFADVQTRYGERWLFFHRQDLHAGLRQMAQDPAIAEAPPAKIHLDAAVVDIDCIAGTFKLQDGTKYKKDLLIIASGVHCRFVETVIDRPNPVIKTGRTVYRCLVPMSDVMADPLTAQLFENQPPGLMGPHIPSIDTLCGSFTCRKNTVLNLVYVYPTKPEAMAKDDWNSPTSLAEVDAVTEPFHPAVRALPRKSADLKAYNMITREELPTFVKGKAVLIGDAAHPMLTNHAQGVSMAIESTGALEIFFHHCRTRREDIVERLRHFNEFRLPRCVTTQIMSNAKPGPDSYPDTLKRVRRYFDGPLPAANSKPWSESFRDFFFSYHIFDESSRFLAALTATKTTA